MHVRGEMARSEPIPILFTHYGGQWIRGSERVLLDLLTHLDPARVRPILWCNGTAMADAGRAAGVLTYRSDFAYYFDYGSPRFGPGRYAGLVRETIQLARRHAVRIVHASSAAPTQWLVPATRWLGLPLLAHLHCRYLRRSRYALLLHQASLVAGVSREVLAGLEEDGMPPGRLRVIHNGIDFARVERSGAGDLRTELGLAAGETVVASVGYLHPVKGHDVALRALARLAPAQRPILVIAGEGPDRAILEALAGTLSIGGRVRFLGFRTDMARVYRTADIVVQASRAEGFGLAAAEAGYLARPVVASCVGGLPEVVEDGVSGLLVPVEDAQALARALERLVADVPYRRKLGTAAREHVVGLFAAPRMAEAFMAAYEDLLAPSRRYGGRGPAIWEGTLPYRRLLHRSRRMPV